MKPVNPTEMPSLEFDGKTTSHKIRLQSDKIGWIHSLTQKGAKFDLSIKDAFGRTMVDKKNCGSDTDRYGEFINLKSRIGEEIEVVVENIKNSEKVNLFIN